MSVVEPLVLSAAVHAVAVILDGAPVRVVSLQGRGAVAVEPDTAVVSVTVHLGSAEDVDLVADLFDLGITAPEPFGPLLYGREAEWKGGVYVSLFSAPVPAAGDPDTASGKAAA